MPIAVIIGVAGFIGSFLAEELLHLNVQVVGVDNLKTGRKENLLTFENVNHFLFFEGSVNDKKIFDDMYQLPRLDYVFFLAEDPDDSKLLTQGISHVLDFVNNFEKQKELPSGKVKTAFVSTSSMYNTTLSEYEQTIKDAESSFATYIKDNDLNGRIVRLSPVFGPRMHFRSIDPLIKLIQAVVTNDVFSYPLEQSEKSTALYISDALVLIMKSTLLGSTRNKIFDGTRRDVINVAQIKKIFFNFHPESGSVKDLIIEGSDSPNFLRTMKELSWHPKADLLKSLQKTIGYFKEHEGIKAIDSSGNQRSEVTPEIPKNSTEIPKVDGWTLESQKVDLKNDNERKEEMKIDANDKSALSFWYFIGSGILFVVFSLLFILPVMIFFNKWYINGLKESLATFPVATDSIQKLNWQMFLFEQSSPVAAWLSLGEEKGALPYLSVQTIQKFQTDTTVLYALQDGLNGLVKLKDAFSQYNDSASKAEESLLNLNDGEISLEKAIADGYNGSLPLSTIKSYVEQFKVGELFASSTFSLLYPSHKQRYLVLLENNNQITNSGGKVVALATVTTQKNTQPIVDITTFPATASGKLLGPKVATAQELILKINNNLSSVDARTNAKMIENLVKSESGEVYDGVLFVNYDGLKSLIPSNKGIAVTGITQPVTRANFSTVMEQLLTNDTYFPILETMYQHILISAGSIGKDPSMYSRIVEALDNKDIVIVPNQIDSFAVLSSSHWTGSLPPQKKVEVGENRDFLSVLTENTATSSSQVNLQKLVKAQTSFTSNGSIEHDIVISLQNNSGQKSQPKISLLVPIHSQLQKAYFKNQTGQIDILSQTKSLGEGNMVLFSYTPQLSPNEQAQIHFIYTPSIQLTYNGNLSDYILTIWNQNGAGDTEYSLSLNPPSGTEVIQTRPFIKQNNVFSYQTVVQNEDSYYLEFQKKSH